MAEIKKFVSSSGVEIFSLPVLAFPNHITNCYLVYADKLTLIDTGSVIPNSNKSLESCLAEMEASQGRKVGLADIERVIITHGHVDHFGGLNFVRKHSKAEIGIHVLDMTTVRNFSERQIISSKNLEIYLGRAGLSEDKVAFWISENKWSKNVFKAMPVDFTINDGDEIGGMFKVFHTPGHCPGQICMQLDDILFTADHILSRITPNQSPEFIIRYNGVGHYYESLRRVRDLPGVRIGLGGHEDTIEDVPARSDDIIKFHDRRLDRAMEICKAPKDISEIALEMFPRASGYHKLLAILEAGAHVEYLYERGRLVVANVDEIEDHPNPTLVYEHG